MTLNELPIGKSGVITAVHGEGALRLRFLDMGLIPHTTVLVCKAAPLGDPIELHLRGYSLTIRKEDARMIEIEPLPDGTDTVVTQSDRRHGKGGGKA